LALLQLRLDEVDLLARQLRNGIVDTDETNPADVAGVAVRITIFAAAAAPPVSSAVSRR